ncbi:MAG: DNA polymerase IV [Planctomycetes bacterium]|nr:DNA polymerase IV [Planctomycetota bacterium]
MSALRTILHADMDAFYAAIEQRDHPEWRGKPVIVGGAGPRQVVSTASYEARTFGVRSAMPGVRAKQLCPHGIFVAPRMDAYEAVSAQVRAVFDRYTDLVEPLSLDEAFLDVTGSRALFGDGPTIAARIKAEVLSATQLTVSVGVASSKYVAKVASDLDKPDGLVVVAPGDERAFLAPLPVARLWGVGPALQQQLERAGLRTIGDVQSRSERDLVAAFGARLGEHLHVLANGLDARPVESERDAKSLGHELTFAEDLTTADEVHGVLLQLAEMVGRRLRRQGVRGGVVRLKLRYGDFTTFTRQRTVPATDDDLVIAGVARELLAESWDRARGVRLLGVIAASLAPAGAPAQRTLFDGDPRKRGSLLQAMDAIRDRHGDEAVRRAGERRLTTPFGPDGAPEAPAGGNAAP